MKELQLNRFGITVLHQLPLMSVLETEVLDVLWIMDLH